MYYSAYLSHYFIVYICIDCMIDFTVYKKVKRLLFCVLFKVYCLIRLNNKRSNNALSTLHYKLARFCISRKFLVALVAKLLVTMKKFQLKEITIVVLNAL